MPEPLSPTMPSVSPLATVMLTCCDRAHDAAPGGEFDGEVAHVEQRQRAVVVPELARLGRLFRFLCHRVHVLRCGSTRSRRPSPSRLKQNTAIISAAPGNSAIHHSPEMMLAGAFRHHDAPFRRRRPDAEPDERQAGGVEDGVAHGERNLHHHDRHDVGQNVHQQNAEIAVAGQPRRLHEAGLAPHVGFGARDAHIKREIDDRGGDHDVGHGVAERGDDAHGQHEQRKRHDGVGDAADDAVGPAAEETGGDAGKAAHDEDQRDRGDAR